MADRDVLELALNDQRDAEARIEDLKRQIADEEAHIASIEGFVSTYREYEQRLGGDTSSWGSQEHNSEETPVTPYAANNF